MKIRQTDVYARWFRKLKDVQDKVRINIALQRCKIAGEVVGDVKPVGDGVFEMRIHVGPGYRIYYMSRGNQLMLLVIGGDKSTQQRDITKAKQLATEIIREGSWE
ncbi:type II toxin-antitoxin system RelE/ParE family toxin [Trueperella pyogenes]|uniref:type II toxin-antitoxin system RelE/ParE family toxin n=1 Tax=Trueperella pyogenes TaxID=1661 RepID=UPI00324DCA20